MPETIYATINRVRYRADSGWTIAATSAGVIKGTIPFDPDPGLVLELTGAWVHSEFSGGNEFEFQRARLHLPTSSRALLDLVVLRVKGLGQTAAAQIWCKYREDWRTTTYLEIPGMNASKRDAWLMALDDLQYTVDQDNALTFLLAHGCTMNMAHAAWNKWERDTISTINADPYNLTYLHGYGFKDVDSRVRDHFAIPDDDPRRATAGIMYAMRQAINEGATAISRAHIAKEVIALLGGNYPIIREAADALYDAKKLVKLGEDKLTTGDCLMWEMAILQRFTKM
ncbi:MAG: hypothetical protein OEN49_09100 [Gammaproteobacteria bacterium]|nr:hypothetical protein [Gammaproteobacteria bacterium]